MTDADRERAVVRLGIDWRYYLNGNEAKEYRDLALKAKQLDQEREQLTYKMHLIRNRCAQRRRYKRGILSNSTENSIQNDVLQKIAFMFCHDSPTARCSKPCAECIVEAETAVNLVIESVPVEIRELPDATTEDG